MPASRRDDLIDAALRAFTKHGFHASGLDRILSEGNLSRMTLYNHFKGKDELILAALQRQDEQTRQAMETAVAAATADPVGQLLAVFDFYAQWLAEGGSEHGCLFQNAAAEFEDAGCAIRQLAAANKQALLSYLHERCQSAGAPEPDALALQLLILIQGMVNTAHAFKPPPPEENPQATPGSWLKVITDQSMAAAEALIESALALEAMA